MGLELEAHCADCGFAQGDLRLGGSHAQIAAHDRSHFQVYPAACCRRLQSVEVFLGQPLPEAVCEACAAGLPLEAPYRISTLKGEQLTGHRCPACAADDALVFTRTGAFT